MAFRLRRRPLLERTQTHPRAAPATAAMNESPARPHKSSSALHEIGDFIDRRLASVLLVPRQQLVVQRLLHRGLLLFQEPGLRFARQLGPRADDVPAVAEGN